MKNLLFTLIILFTLQAQAQYRTPEYKKLKGEITIIYKVEYEKKITEAQKKQSSYCDEVVMVLNKDYLINRKHYNINGQDSYTLIDYDAKEYFNCRVKGGAYEAIRHDFIKNKKLAILVPNESKVIAGIECQKYRVKVKGEDRYLYTTKQIGLNETNNYEAEGFALEKPYYNKTFGYFKLVASKVIYGDIPDQIFSLEKFRIYEKDEYKERHDHLRHSISKSKYELLGKKAPVLRAVTIDGQKINSKKQSDKIFVLSFWFAKSNLCLKSFADHSALKKKYSDKNVEFVSIALDQEYKVEQILKRKPIDYKVVADGRYYADLYGIKAYPSNLLIGKSGKITFFHTGGRSDLNEMMSHAIDKELTSE